MTYYTELGEKIRIERVRKRKSKKEIAGLIGVHPNQLYKYEGGKDRIPTEKLSKIANILEIDIKELLPKTEVNYENLD